MDRRDLYGECNTVGAPVEAFSEECCKHCVNPDCTRSMFGKTKFDQRVATWYDRLFANVPRMDPGDPRFGNISAQKFMLINPSLTVLSGSEATTQRSWVDPRDLDQPAPQAAPAPAPRAPEPPPVVVQAQPAPEPLPPPVAAPEPPPAPSAEPSRLPQHLAFTNTPLQQGQMLKPPAGAPAPKASWDVAPASTDTEGVKVVQRGARVKLG